MITMSGVRCVGDGSEKFMGKGLGGKVFFFLNNSKMTDHKETL